MLRVKYYDADHINTKEINNVRHVNFYASDNTACVFHFFKDPRTGKDVDTITDVAISELITIEEA